MSKKKKIRVTKKEKGPLAQEIELFDENEVQENTDDFQEDGKERDGNSEDASTPTQDQQQQIIKMGSITTAKGKHIIHCLTVVGQIEGHYILPPQNKTTKYEHVIPQLVAIQEAPRETLAKEYERDVKRGLNPSLPRNYFVQDDPQSIPPMIWRSHANLLFSNWLNYFVYQRTPFDLNELGGK